MRVLNVSDIQHFSTGDGPGIRTTVFLKGCNLRCPWCHNPETISAAPQTLTFAHANRTQTYGHAMTAQQVLAQVLEDEDFYCASGGGVTFSGGEPLLQADGVAEIAKEVKPDFIKTSTGFGTSGATPEDVKLMKDTVGAEVKVKAAGGIRDWETCKKMIEAGAERIGTSSSIKICEEYEKAEV